MKQENKALLIKYITCFCVAALMTAIVFWIEGFFTSDVARNIQVLGDGFTVSGGLMLMFAAMMFISGEGALIGIGWVLRNAFLTFVPMGRKKHELYREYRERKLKDAKKSSDHCLLVTGLVFMLIGVVLTVVWYMNWKCNIRCSALEII